MPLQVTTAIPYGNATDVRIDESTSPPTLEFAAHPHGGPEALWFCFRVESAGPAPPQLRLVLKYYRSLAYSHPDRTDTIRPVWRTTREDWRRLDAPQRVEQPDGQIQLAWTVTAPPAGDWLELAFCYPHGREHLDALVAGSAGYWKADSIGVSAAGRPIVRLSHAYGNPSAKLPGVYLIAQQHAAETPGGWVLHGLLGALAELKASDLLAWSVPLTNIDGVEAGDYGKDNFPYDLNRAWGIAPMRHETLVIQHDMRLWAERCTPTLALDFHAPGPCETTGIYCYRPDAQQAPERAAAAQPWIDLFRGCLGEYAAPDFARVVHYRSRWETPDFCDFAGLEFGCPALAFETPYALAAEGKILLTREHYQDIGRRLASAIVARAVDDPR